MSKRGSKHGRIMPRKQVVERQFVASAGKTKRTGVRGNMPRHIKPATVKFIIKER